MQRTNPERSRGTDMNLITIRPELLVLSQDQISALLPFLVVFGGSVIAILASIFRGLNPKWTVFGICLATSIAGIYLSSERIANPSQTLFNGMMVSDSFA